MKRILSLACLLLFVHGILILSSCSIQPKESPSKKGSGAHPEPQHGGVLFTWGGEKYHLEWVRDKKNKKAVVYMLNKKVYLEEQPLDLIITSEEPPLELKLKPFRQERDPEDKTSRFSVTHEVLGKAEKLKMEISGKIGKKPYVGRLDEANPHQH